MADNFVPKDPTFTVKFMGPNGWEWVNVFERDGQDGNKWWGGKDARENYLNVNKFVKKEDRQQKQAPKQSEGW